MIFTEKEITLKNGKTAVLKTPDVSDAAGMLSFITKACGETEFLLRYPEEYAEMTIEKEEQWVDRLRRSENTLMIACFIEGRVVGNCEISFLSGIKTRHRAGIAIAILKEYWNLGIGSAFFTEMLAAAQAREGIEFVCLEFMEGNERGRALYEKFGFKVVGERPDAFKLRDGSYRKEIFMNKSFT